MADVQMVFKNAHGMLSERYRCCEGAGDRKKKFSHMAYFAVHLKRKLLYLPANIPSLQSQLGTMSGQSGLRTTNRDSYGLSCRDGKIIIRPVAGQYLFPACNDLGIEEKGQFSRRIGKSDCPAGIALAFL